MYSPKRFGLGSWQVQDAKARFSEFLDATMKKGPQVVTRGGSETAVLVPIGEWNRFQKAARPTLEDLLQAPGTRSENLIPERDVERWTLREDGFHRRFSGKLTRLPEPAIIWTRAKMKLPTQQCAERSTPRNYCYMPNEDVCGLEVRTMQFEHTHTGQAA